jgi:hypothetical protein
MEAGLIGDTVSHPYFTGSPSTSPGGQKWRGIGAMGRRVREVLQ